MVNRVVVSEYSASPPLESGRVKIASGPLYGLGRVQGIVAEQSQLQLWTEKCRKDVHKLFDSDLERVADLVLCLRTTDYRDSEWCDNGRSAIAACDSYSVRRMERMPATGREMQAEYFVKFAVGRTGQLVLLVSCHV